MGVLAAAGRRFGFTADVERLPYSADHFLKTGETLPNAAFRHLRDEVDAIFAGALGDPRVAGNEHARDILLGLPTCTSTRSPCRCCTPGSAR